MSPWTSNGYGQCPDGEGEGARGKEGQKAQEVARAWDTANTSWNAITCPSRQALSGLLMGTSSELSSTNVCKSEQLQSGMHPLALPQIKYYVGASQK